MPLARRSLAALLAVTLSITPFTAVVLAAEPTPQLQQTSDISTTPVLPQIAGAKKVFLTNSGADVNFPVDSTKAFNDVSAALQAWGHYQFVAAPEQADLIFQLHSVAPISNITSTQGRVSTYVAPAFQLVILDPKTNSSIWTITSPVYYHGSESSKARWYAISLSNLVSRVKVVAGQPLTPTETADLATAPKRHVARNVSIAAGALVVVSVGTALLLHHLYSSSVSSAQSQQAAFCTANNIPLNQCAGAIR